MTEPKRNDVAAELTAFANSHGGIIVLGVEDKSREVVGIPREHLDTVVTWLRQICTDLIKPLLDAEILIVELPCAGNSREYRT